jgi:hypothetical protein
MARPKKEITTETETIETKEAVTPNDLGWNDYDLGLLSDDEKI